MTPAWGSQRPVRFAVLRRADHDHKEGCSASRAPVFFLRRFRSKTMLTRCQNTGYHGSDTVSTQIFLPDGQTVCAERVKVRKRSAQRSGSVSEPIPPNPALFYAKIPAQGRRFLHIADFGGIPRLRAGPGSALTAHRAVIHSLAPRIPPSFMIKRSRPKRAGIVLWRTSVGFDLRCGGGRVAASM